jgi:hypothetical protein
VCRQCGGSKVGAHGVNSSEAVMKFKRFAYGFALIIATAVLIGCPKSSANLEFEENGGRTKEKKFLLEEGQLELQLTAFSLWGDYENYTLKLQADLAYNDSLEERLGYQNKNVSLKFEGQKVPKFGDEIYDSGFDELNRTKRISFGFQINPSKIDFNIASRENPDEAEIEINIDGLILFDKSPIKLGTIHAYDKKLTLWKEKIQRLEAKGK